MKKLTKTLAVAAGASLVAGATVAVKKIKEPPKMPSPTKQPALLRGTEYDIGHFGDGVKAIANIKNKEEFRHILFNYLEYTFRSIISGIADKIPESDLIANEEDYVSKNFLPGHETFISEPDKKAKWSLGYSQASLLPPDLLDGFKDYYLGGYLFQNFPANTVETILDDMKVRIICLDDGSGRGTTVYASVESIGVSNTDIRIIRGILSDFAKENNIVSINISATHTHSAIDTLGLWNPPISTVINNIVHLKTGAGKLESGQDRAYMAFIHNRISETIKEAFNSMEKGTLYCSVKNIEEYITDTRGISEFLPNLTRLRFVPNGKNKKETIIVNMSAHPYTTGLKTDNSSGKELSADYTYYFEEIVNKAGYNFMFIQGAISGIYSNRHKTNDGLPLERRSEQAVRYGHEMGKITLALTMTKEDIIRNELLSEPETEEKEREIGGKGYSLWYEDWEPVDETEVSPILNIRCKEVLVPLQNPVIKMVGLLNLSNVALMKSSDGSYCAITEVGYMEIGDKLKIAMMPGEFEPEIATGKGPFLPELSFTGRPFPYPCLNDIVGEDVLVFGLANDEIGYIVPDNDYALLFFDKSDFFGDHYQETISPGKYTASALVAGFRDIINEIKEKI